jgi:hypothetical protein
MMELEAGTRIWIAACFTELHRGFQGLSSLVETVLEQATSLATGDQRSPPHLKSEMWGTRLCG